MTDAELRQAVAANVRRRMEADPSLDSQPKLGARAGISKSTVGYILRAENDCSIDKIAALARAFGCDPWELMVVDEESRLEAWRRIMTLPPPR